MTTKLTTTSLALCHAIEAVGCSPLLTRCSVLASELHTEAKRLAELADKMKRFAVENYPPDESGQVDFVRGLLEGYAQEIAAPEPNESSSPATVGEPKGNQ